MSKTINTKNVIADLIKQGLLSKEEATEVMRLHSSAQRGFVSALLEKSKLTEQEIASLLAKKSGLTLFKIDAVDPLTLPIEALPASSLAQYKIIPLIQRNGTLFVAFSEPSVLGTLEQLSQVSQCRIHPVLTEHSAFNKVFAEVVPHTKLDRGSPAVPTTKTNSVDMPQLNDSKLDKISIQLDGIKHADMGDFPVVRFINKIILDALQQQASDIHFEPFENSYRIRIRVDGILLELATPNVALAPRLSARIKVMSGLDISERRIPQDGRFKINLGKNKSVGFRVNTCPTLYGEKIVLRILDPESAQVGIEGLGFTELQKEIFIKSISKQQGMILVTGPTGSGKTVTLYTALNKLNDTEKNISTAEDPVEIYLPGINQVNINSKTGLDFAAALRAFLRQDPDIIMVGEIRDKETSDIAIKAAQTGHLVLSTLHTNSAAETLTRLDNMGIPSYNIATSVNLVIAQRLLRRLCEHCRQTLTLEDSILLEQGFSQQELASLTVYQAVGCEQCHAGYSGRCAIFEVLPISTGIKTLIMQHGNSIDIEAKAQEEGMITLLQAGLDKVRHGITSLDELNRVVG